MSIFSTLALCPLIVLGRWLSNRIGRKPTILSGIILGALCIQLAYELLQILGNAYLNSASNSALLGIGLILFLLAPSLGLAVGPQTALLAELFPAKNRNSAATLPHNLAAGWVGGMPPDCGLVKSNLWQ
ncbi:MFS transporter [Polynucleobacter necessarius]|uniref:MFS transporter n=1 Tax=Polynucleobacter necessarius TaxID=576610 RepID=UPI0039E4A2B5